MSFSGDLDERIIANGDRTWRELSEREQRKYKHTAKFYFRIGIIFGVAITSFAAYGLVIFKHACS